MKASPISQKRLPHVSLSEIGLRDVSKQAIGKFIQKIEERFPEFTKWGTRQYMNTGKLYEGGVW